MGYGLIWMLVDASKIYSWDCECEYEYLDESSMSIYSMQNLTEKYHDKISFGGNLLSLLKSGFHDYPNYSGATLPALKQMMKKHGYDDLSDVSEEIKSDFWYLFKLFDFENESDDKVIALWICG
jgi:hypothetical protein